MTSKIVKLSTYKKDSERGKRTKTSSFRDGIFKLLRSPGIDSKESISPAYVACPHTGYLFWGKHQNYRRVKFVLSEDIKNKNNTTFQLTLYCVQFHGM
jgi:hypothetical protein